MKHMRDTFVIIAATALLIVLLAYATARTQELNSYVGIVEVLVSETGDSVEEIILVGETEEFVIMADDLGMELVGFAGRNVVINGMIVRNDEGTPTLAVKEYFVE